VTNPSMLSRRHDSVIGRIAPPERTSIEKWTSAVVTGDFDPCGLLHRWPLAAGRRPLTRRLLAVTIISYYDPSSGTDGKGGKGGVLHGGSRSDAARL